MLSKHTRRRPRERGQALLLALVLIGTFALLLTAALRMASVGAVARGQSAVTAGSNALSEASVLLANSNEARFDVAPCPAIGAAAGTAVFDAGGVNDTVTYSLPHCTESFVGDGAGRRCALCLLNPSPASGAALTSKRFLAVAGEIDINGGSSTTAAGGSGFVCSSASSPPPIAVASCDGGGIIRYFNAAAKPDAGAYGNWSPAPQSSAGPLTDPLLTRIATPSTVGPIVDKTLHTGDTWAPGTYRNVSIKNDTALIAGGVYVITGGLTVDNNSALSMANATATAMIYFGPAATLTFGTHSSLQVKALPSTDASYPSIGLYFDRTNATTVDDSGTTATLSVSGTIYGARTTFDFGDAQPSVLPSRLIAWSVTFSGNPNGTALNLDGGGFPAPCSQYEVTGSTSVSGTDADVPANTRGVAPYGKGHGQFQECRGGVSTTSAISQFNYVP
jgi:hypothetical protein